MWKLRPSGGAFRVLAPLQLAAMATCCYPCRLGAGLAAASILTPQALPRASGLVAAAGDQRQLLVQGPGPESLPLSPFLPVTLALSPCSGTVEPGPRSRGNHHRPHSKGFSLCLHLDHE